MSDAFVKAVHRFARRNGIPWVDFVKGQRKDDVAHEYLARFTGTDGVLFVGRAQEKATAFQTEKRLNRETGKSYPWITPATRVVNYFYFYCVDDDFGPFFLKFCSYFPYTGKLCLLTEPWQRCCTPRGRSRFGWLLSPLVIESDEPVRELSALAVPQHGALRESGNPFEPFRLLDASGQAVAPVAAYLRDLQARGRPATTQRSYGMALLRWFRFLGAIEVPWEHATRVEARDFTRWVRVAAKPARPHWRHRDESAQSRPTPAKARVSPNPVTGTTPPGTKYATATAAHSETVLRGFYEFHLEAGSGPMVNPFSLSRKGRGGRANAHHNPMEPFRNERSGLYRPRVGPRAPRQIPMPSSTSCSPRSARTATGPWWRCGCRPARGHPSCSASPAGIPTPANS